MYERDGQQYIVDDDGQLAYGTWLPVEEDEPDCPCDRPVIIYSDGASTSEAQSFMDHVHIPDEVFAVLQWEDEDLPAICVVNQSLATFEPKAVFAWHLSISVDCKKLDANGMPRQAEKVILDKIADALAKNLKAQGNALFLARTTWNGTQQHLYRVCDSEVASAYLVDTIKSFPREVTFRMEHDETWKHAKWYLQHWEKDT